MPFLIERRNSPEQSKVVNDLPATAYTAIELPYYTIHVFNDHLNSLSLYQDDIYFILTDGYIAGSSGASPAEITGRLYGSEGYSAFNKISGNFSAAIFSKTDGTCHLTVDWLGIGRLFYTDTPNGLLISNDLKTLVNHPAVSMEIDPISLKSFIIHGGGYNSQYTVYKGIKRFLPAEYKIITNHQIESKNYLKDFTFTGDPSKASVEQTRESIFTSIIDCYDANTLAELSGGLDSSTNVSVLAKFSKHPPQVLSLYSNLSGGEYDERKYQNLVTDAYNLERNQINVDDHFSAFDIQRFHDDFPAQPNMSVLYGQDLRNSIKQFTAAHKMHSCISGSGGDQVFFGDSFPPMFITDHFRNFQYGTLFREIKNWSKNYSYLKLVQLMALAPSNFLKASETADGPNKLPGWLNNQEGLKEINSRTFVPAIQSNSFFNKFYLNTIQLMGFYIGNGLSCRKQFMTMKFPLFDRRIATQMINFHPHAHITPSADRLLLRQSLKGVLPEAIRTRTDKGGSSRPELLYIKKHWDSIEHLVSGDQLAQLGLISKMAFQNAVEKLKHGYVGIGFDHPRLLAAINAEIWLSTCQSFIKDNAINHYLSHTKR